MPMDVTSDMNGQYWVAACPAQDCRFRARSASFTAVENAADEHEQQCARQQGDDN